MHLPPRYERHNYGKIAPGCFSRVKAQHENEHTDERGAGLRARNAARRGPGIPRSRHERLRPRRYGIDARRFMPRAWAARCQNRALPGRLVRHDDALPELRRIAGVRVGFLVCRQRFGRAALARACLASERDVRHLHAALEELERAATQPAAAITWLPALRALLSAGVENDLEDRLRPGDERVGIAVGEVKLFVAQAKVIGDREVRADAFTVSAAVRLRRKSDDAAQAERKRGIRADLIRV